MNGKTDVVIVTVWAVFVALFIGLHILTESFLALLAHERHLARFSQLMIFSFSVAFCAVKPPLATWCANGHLCIQDVLARGGMSTAHA